MTEASGPEIVAAPESLTIGKIGKQFSGVRSFRRGIGPTRSLTDMLPIRVASIGLLSRLGGLLLLLVLGGAFLNPGEAGPLKGPGVNEFRELIDSKNDPTPSRKTAPAELTAYRGKVRRA